MYFGPMGSLALSFILEESDEGVGLKCAIGYKDEPEVGDQQDPRKVAQILGEGTDDAFDDLMSGYRSRMNDLLPSEQVGLDHPLGVILLIPRRRRRGRLFFLDPIYFAVAAFTQSSAAGQLARLRHGLV